MNNNPQRTRFESGLVDESVNFVGQQLTLDRRADGFNPLTKLDGIGKRRHGKPQLRIDEARKWLTEAKKLANFGEPGAVAAMVSLLMGLRCSEIVERVVRDLDDEGRLLWIPETKTEAGRRKLAVPPMLQPYLVALTEAKLPGARLFGYHTREWPRHWVKRICNKAHVPEVTAHGMRGLHSSLALAAGTSSHVVAACLGHESIATTLQSYADPSAVSHGKQQVVLHVLEGGK
jgi:integrase